MSLWVVDTSPLIFLAKLDHLDLLARGANEVLVPSAVLQEVQVYQDEARHKIEEALRSWLTVRKVTDHQLVEVLMADLDRGEAEVIALAREAKADRVIMDDLDGRRFARRVDLEPVGTVGLLLAARLRGELPSLGVELERLRAGGFRVSKALVDAALLSAGESQA
jgi:predicted nucleic acid-binding protein